MKLDNYIDEYIEKEKNTLSNPFLSTRVMSRIETENEKVTGKNPVLQRLALAASIALVVTLGFGLGKVYTPTDTQKELALNINDTQMENFATLIENDYANE